MGGLLTGLTALVMSSQLPVAPSVFGLSVETPAAPLIAPDPADELFDAGTDKVARMTVKVMVNGKGPYNFVVDTAADRSVISSRLAAELGLPAGKNLMVHGVTGSSVVRSVMVESLKVGSREIFDVRAPVFSERALGAVGLLGIDALEDQRVTMDFRSDKMTVHAAPRREVSNDDEVIVVSARRRFGQLILADVSVQKDKVYAIVDSGAQVSIGNSKLREKLFKRKNAPLPMPITLIGVDGTTTEAELVVINEMRIGTMFIRNLPVAFADVRPFELFKVDKSPALLLGTDMLRTFERVALDFEKKKVRFARRRPSGLVYTP